MNIRFLLILVIILSTSTKAYADCDNSTIINLSASGYSKYDINNICKKNNEQLKNMVRNVSNNSLSQFISAINILAYNEYMLHYTTDEGKKDAILKLSELKKYNLVNYEDRVSKDSKILVVQRTAAGQNFYNLSSSLLIEILSNKKSFSGLSKNDIIKFIRMSPNSSMTKVVVGDDLIKRGLVIKYSTDSKYNYKMSQSARKTYMQVFNNIIK